MNPKCDRRDILPILKEHFPSLPDDISSDDLHGFLNAQTGLDVPLDEENATAFDKWRQALALTGIPVWGYSQEHVQQVQQRGMELKAREVARIAALPETLKTLAGEAPGTPLANP